MFAYQYVNVSCTETRLPPKRSNPNKLQTTIGWQYIIHRWRGRQHLKIGNIWGEKQPAKAFKMKLAKTEKRGRKEVGTKEVRLDRMAQEARYSRRRGWGEKRQSKKTVNDWPFDGSLCTVSSLSGRGKQVSRCWSRSYRTRWQTMTGISHGGGPPLFQLTGRLETPNHPPPITPPPPHLQRQSYDGRRTYNLGGWKRFHVQMNMSLDNAYHLHLNMSQVNVLHLQMNMSMDNVFHLHMNMSPSTCRWTCPWTMYSTYRWTCHRTMHCIYRWLCPGQCVPHTDEHVLEQCIPRTDEHIPGQCIPPSDGHVSGQCKWTCFRTMQVHIPTHKAEINMPSDNVDGHDCIMRMKYLRAMQRNMPPHKAHTQASRYADDHVLGP